MTERRFRDNEYVRRGEALGSAAFGWILGIGAAVIIALLVIVSYSNTTDTASSTPADRYKQRAATHTAEHHGFRRAT